MNPKMLKKQMIISNAVAIILISVVSFTLLYCLGITGLSAVGITTALAALGSFFNKRMLGGIFVLSGLALVVKTLSDKLTGLYFRIKEGRETINNA